MVAMVNPGHGGALDSVTPTASSAVSGSAWCPVDPGAWQWPHELKRLPESQLPDVVRRLRERLIADVLAEGGHFAASLGVVELTVALHYIFETPEDRIVWDTGHQAYPHKMLTGRWDQLRTIRKRGGLSGFPRREESVYDAFGVGHAGTAVSAALGIALGLGGAHKAVAVVGDGSLTAGLSFEGLNHAVETGADLLVILNHNGMAISPNVGGLHHHLAELKETARTPDLTGGLPPRMPDSALERLGWATFGAVDGHDVIALCRTLRRLRDMTGPRVLHILTKKGQGYAPAEENPTRFHAVSPYCPASKLTSKPRPSASFSQVFGTWLTERATWDSELVCITPAMIDGSGLAGFAEAHPERLYDAGIAEQHAVTVAAGLATAGKRPVVAIYSSFLQRAYDSLVHDVALQGLPVVFAIDRAGIVGPDGATHAGTFDLSFMRCVPNMRIAAPADGTELRGALDCACQLAAPVAVRYPRGSAADIGKPCEREPWVSGKARRVRIGSSVALLSFGPLLERALEVGEALDATVVDMRWVKPLDEDMIDMLAESHVLIVTLEDNALAGGAGSAVGEYVIRKRLGVGLLNLGLPDRFLDHGSRGEVLAECGLDVAGIRDAIAQWQQERATDDARSQWR